MSTELPLGSRLLAWLFTGAVSAIRQHAYERGVNDERARTRQIIADICGPNGDDDA